MSFDLKITTSIQVDDETPRTYERTFSNLTLRHQTTLSLSSAAGVLWDVTANGALGDFDVAILRTDNAVNLEWVTALGDGDASYHSAPLGATVPLIFVGDDAFNNFTTDVFAGDLDLIEKIRAKETAGNTALVTLELYS